MSEVEELERNLTIFVHDLFSMHQYAQWREYLSNQETNRWYSLIVELEKSHCSLSLIKNFGEAVYSKLVYRCIPSPDFKTTGKKMFLFNLSGRIWHSLIHHSNGQVNRIS